jgi:hypothetical protein
MRILEVLCSIHRSGIILVFAHYDERKSGTTIVSMKMGVAKWLKMLLILWKETKFMARLVVCSALFHHDN